MFVVPKKYWATANRLNPGRRFDPGRSSRDESGGRRVRWTAIWPAAGECTCGATCGIGASTPGTPTGDWQTGCLWWEVAESRFHVDLKSNFALQNNSMEFLLGPITRRINVLYESRMKWTWHHSKLAVEEVSFFGGLRVVLLQLLSIHDRAVGVTNLGVMLLSAGSWSKRPHSKTATPKTATTLLATKTATTKMATLYWSKRPHREDHYQNGQTAFGQNGHKGRITAKTATLYLVKTATKGGSLPQRPHCIWSKRPHRKDHYQNGHTAFGQNGHK